MRYRVGDIARLAGVSVKTLHLYDEMGLVKAQRTEADHRVYDQAALDRLTQVLGYRALGFSLEAIEKILAGDWDERTHLQHQLTLLRSQAARLQQLADAVQKRLEAKVMGIELTPEEQFAEFAPEAEERWGHTDAYAESQRRTARYRKDDWKRIQAEADQLNRDFAALLVAGESPASERAGELVERHRAHIDSCYYPCSGTQQRALGELYVADERFARTYDAYAPGLATFVAAAIAEHARGEL
jgi:MerR family transcriptional regulator, thiopeptide resistance regulator